MAAWKAAVAVEGWRYHQARQGCVEREARGEVVALITRLQQSRRTCPLVLKMVLKMVIKMQPQPHSTLSL